MLIKMFLEKPYSFKSHQTGIYRQISRRIVLRTYLYVQYGILVGVGRRLFVVTHIHARVQCIMLCCIVTIRLY